MAALSLLVGVVALILLLPTWSDLLSITRVLTRRRASTRAPEPDAPPRLLFLVPAHNEEVLIRACVRSLTSLRYPRERCSIVVIADNCGDRTAEIARSAGARCLERADPTKPGKPHAIAWALEQLPFAQYDAVVIVDADTMVDANFATELVRAGGSAIAQVAVQGYFDVSNRTESPITRMAAVLAAATHRFAYRLKSYAGINVPLVGNGMAIGRDVLARHGWQALSICEDWEMYALLTVKAVRILGAPGARIYSQEAQSLRQSSTQRERWTAGRLTVLARLAPRVLASGAAIPQKLDVLAELSAPGPAVHLGLAVVLGGLSLATALPGAPLLLVALGVTLIRPVVYTCAALAVQPDPLRTAAAFAFLPLYTAWRVGSALRALRMVGGGPWVRTERHQHSEAQMTE